MMSEAVDMPTRKELPKRCPFCWKIDEVEWNEFKVRKWFERYFDAGTLNYSKIRDEGFDLFCTRCEEHIRKQDISEEDMQDLSCCGVEIDSDTGICPKCKEHCR